MKRTLRILLLIALVATSCSKENGGETIPDPVRVLLVYAGTDSNLSGYEQVKLQGLREGWTGNPSDHIVAYIDDAEEDARLIEISNLAAGENPRRLASYGTENSASSEVLSRVIADVYSMYPCADSYGLLIFSHGFGWLPKGAYSEISNGRIPESGVVVPKSKAASRSVIMDGTDEMELTDFADAIPAGLFDYIVFEACFMAGIEVAYELKDKTPLILASSAEIVDPGFAPVYSTSTHHIMSGNLPAFAQSAFNHILTYNETDPRRSSTLSVIMTSGFDALADFIRYNCDFSRVVNIMEVQRFDRLKAATLFFDFEDYYSRLLDTDQQRARLSELVADCVDWSAATDTFMNQSISYNGFTVESHSGLTAYITQTQFTGLNHSYASTAWSRAVNADSRHLSELGFFR